MPRGGGLAGHRGVAAYLYGPHQPRSSTVMTSAFSSWDAQAGVRAGVRRAFEDETGKVFFPPSLVPHLSHPVIAQLPQHEHEALTLRHLYQFLLSTTHVETRVVNVGAELIANGRAGVSLSVAGRM